MAYFHGTAAADFHIHNFSVIFYAVSLCNPKTLLKKRLLVSMLKKKKKLKKLQFVTDFLQEFMRPVSAGNSSSYLAYLTFALRLGKIFWGCPASHGISYLAPLRPNKAHHPSLCHMHHSTLTQTGRIPFQGL